MHFAHFRCHNVLNLRIVEEEISSFSVQSVSRKPEDNILIFEFSVRKTVAGICRGILNCAVSKGILLKIGKAVSDGIWVLSGFVTIDHVTLEYRINSC